MLAVGAARRRHIEGGGQDRQEGTAMFKCQNSVIVGFRSRRLRVRPSPRAPAFDLRFPSGHSMKSVFLRVIRPFSRFGSRRLEFGWNHRPNQNRNQNMAEELMEMGGGRRSGVGFDVFGELHTSTRERAQPDPLAHGRAPLSRSTSSIGSTAAILSFANRGLGGKPDIRGSGTAVACQFTKAG